MSTTYATWLDLAASCGEEEILHMVNMWLEHADEYYAMRERMEKVARRVELDKTPKTPNPKRVGKVRNVTPTTSEGPTPDSGGGKQGKAPADVRRPRSVSVTIVHEKPGMGYGTGGAVPTAAALRLARLRAASGLGDPQRETRAAAPDGSGEAL